MGTIINSSHFNMDNYPYDTPKIMVIDDQDGNYEITPEFVNAYYCENPSQQFNALRGYDSNSTYYIKFDNNNNPIDCLTYLGG